MLCDYAPGAAAAATACSILPAPPQAVRFRLREAFRRGAEVGVSSIAVFELWYGVAECARIDADTERLAVFLAPLDTPPFTDEDARLAGMIRAELERAATPISAYHTLIAGQAPRRGLILVTQVSPNSSASGELGGLRPGSNQSVPISRSARP